jgi:hypothetical protein
VLKVKKVEISKLEIKDVLDKLIEIGHGSTLTKKELLAAFRQENAMLKSNHIQTFVKECFDKEKRPLDSKVSIC